MSTVKLTRWCCKHCGSQGLCADGDISLNDPEDHQSYDDTHCRECGSEGNSIAEEWEFDVEGGELADAELGLDAPTIIRALLKALDDMVELVDSCDSWPVLPETFKPANDAADRFKRNK